MAVSYGTYTITEVQEGSQIWTTTVAPVSPNYTFTISNLTGDSETSIKVGDIIMYSYYRYTVLSISDDGTTVLTGNRVSIRGATGAASVTYTLIVSNLAIIKDKNGNISPTTITLTAKSQTGSGAMANYAGRFKIETTTNNLTWTTQYTSSANEATKNWTVIDDIIAVRCSLYLKDGTTTLLDQQTIPIVSDGADGTNGKDAYTVILTNENHTFAGNTTSALASEIECNVIAYKGTTQIASTIGTITGQPTGMTTSLLNNGTVNSAFKVTVTTSMATMNGVLTVPVTVDGKTFTKKFTYSLALKGTSGTSENLLMDVYTPSLNSTDTTWSKYLSDATNSTITGQFIAESNLPDPNATHFYRITDSSATTKGRGICFYSSCTPPFVTGHTYRIGCWARKHSGSPKIQFTLGSIGSWMPAQRKIENTEWEWVEVVRTFGETDASKTSQSNTYKRLYIYFYNDNIADSSLDICGFRMEEVQTNSGTARNLLLGTEKLTNWGVVNGATISDGVATFPTITSNSWREIYPAKNFKYDLIRNQYAIFSIKVKAEDGKKCCLNFCIGVDTTETAYVRQKYFNQYVYFIGTGEWQTICSALPIFDYMFVSGSGTVDFNNCWVTVRIGAVNAYWNGFQAKEPQLCLGTTATSWTPAPEDIEEEVSNLRTDLQSQIDEKIQTYYQATAPSWSSATDRAKHNGDLWYCTESDPYTGYEEKNVYRYDSTSNTWVEYSATSELFDAVDGKSTIFYGTTSDTFENVDIGDYLVDSVDGSSYRWNGTQWVKVTDYQTAIDNIEIGGRNLLWNTANPIIIPYVANNIQKYGWTIQSGGNGVGSIKTITDSPVTTLNKTFRISNNTSGNRDFVQVMMPELKTNFNEPHTFSVWVRGVGGNATAIIRSWNTTSGKAAFQKNISVSTEWQRIKILFMPLINSTVEDILDVRFGISGSGSIEYIAPKFERGNKATAWTPAPEDIDEAIDNIQVGGRNLLKESDCLAPIQTSKGITLTYNGNGWFNVNGTVTGTSAGVLCFYGNTQYTSNIIGSGNYTLSIETDGTIFLPSNKTFIQLAYHSDNATNNTIAGEFEILSGSTKVTFTIPENHHISRVCLFIQANATDGVIDGNIRLKLEKGNKATDWTPAPEDVVNEAVNKVEVGGRNLIRNSTNFNKWVVKNGGANGDIWSRSVSGNTSNVNLRPRTWIGTGYLADYYNKTLTISFEIMSPDWSAIEEGTSNTGLNGLAIQLETVNGTPYLSSIGSTGRYFFKRLGDKNYFKTDSDLVDGDWVKITSVPLKIDDTLWNNNTTLIDGYDYFTFSFILRRNGEISFRKPQIELGNKATDFTLAPEDVNADIEEAKKVATNYLSVDSTGIMIADMNDGEQTPSEATGRNVFIDNDSVDIRNGTSTLASFTGDNTKFYDPIYNKELATFGASGAMIGVEGEQRFVIEKNSVRAINSSGGTLFSIVSTDKTFITEAEAAPSGECDDSPLADYITRTLDAGDSTTDNSFYIDRIYIIVSLTNSSKVLTNVKINSIAVTADRIKYNTNTAYGFPYSSSHSIDVPFSPAFSCNYGTSKSSDYVMTATFINDYGDSYNLTFSFKITYNGARKLTFWTPTEECIRTSGNNEAIAKFDVLNRSKYVFSQVISNTANTRAPAITFGTRTGEDGMLSSAFGQGLYAEKDGEFVIGRYNNQELQTDSKYSFVIGNGLTEEHRSNALTIDWSGNICLGIDVTGSETDADLLTAIQNAGWESSVIE